MKLVLDTNAYCLCDVGSSQALEILSRASHYFIPAVVYGELYFGFKHGTRLQENLKRLDRFIREFSVQIISIDRDVAMKFGDIYASLRKKSRPIPTNDIWIAACCMEVGGTLLTADRHFNEVEQVQVEWISG